MYLVYKGWKLNVAYKRHNSELKTHLVVTNTEVLGFILSGLFIINPDQHCLIEYVDVDFYLLLIVTLKKLVTLLNNPGKKEHIWYHDYPVLSL